MKCVECWYFFLIIGGKINDCKWVLGWQEAIHRTSVMELQKRDFAHYPANWALLFLLVIVSARSGWMDITFNVCWVWTQIRFKRAADCFIFIFPHFLYFNWVLFFFVLLVKFIPCRSLPFDLDILMLIEVIKPK